MRKLLVAFITITLSFSSAMAQDTARRASSPPPSKPADVAPVKAKPVEKPGQDAAPRRSLMDRIFGRKTTPPPPTPAPTPTPAPKVKPKAKKPRPAETDEKPDTAHIAKPDGNPEPAAKPDGNPKPDGAPANPPADKPEGTPGTPESNPPAPAPADKPPDEAAQTPKTAGKKGGKKGAKPEVPGLDDATKYKNAKATASEDAAIKELKTKADGAVNESEAHQASVAYNRALFRKIRQVDPSLDKYVDGVEAAMTKRLNAEKKGE